MLGRSHHQVIRSYLLSAAGKCGALWCGQRSIRSFTRCSIFGISLYDRNLELIADAPGLALFLGANDYAIRRVSNTSVAETSSAGHRAHELSVWNRPHSKFPRPMYSTPLRMA